MKKLFFISLYILSGLSLIYPQGFIDNSVAKVGDISISDNEFLERFEMTPGINRQVKGNIESQKIEFLFSLIAEKLWALESLSRNQDTTEVIRFATKAFEKMFIRDAMFQRDIKEQIKISDKELSDGLNQSLIKTLCAFFIFY